MNTTALTALRPQNVEDIQAAIFEHAKLRIVGGNTKPGLTAHRLHAVPLDMTAMTGIVEYDPAEYTITAQAGTPLREIAQVLAEHGQYMPFDPPWIHAGSTLGGTIAAGSSGSQRQRYGSLRDFLIGVRFVDGQGRHVRGGGKVVKNAAGFDLPKLMIGSRGEFGILTEASLKVFPAPPATGMLQMELPSFQEAAAIVAKLARSTFDLYMLDLFHAPEAHSDGYRVTAQLGGLPNTLPARLDQLRNAAGGGDLQTNSTANATQADEQQVQARQELAWTDSTDWLIKCAVTPESAQRLEDALQSQNARWLRLFTNAINSLWLAGAGSLAPVHHMLQSAGVTGVILRGAYDPTAPAHANHPYIGRNPETVFHQRIRATLDPAARLRE